MKMKIKQKRKTKTVLFTAILICLFVISFSTNIKAADDPTMEAVLYETNYELTELPAIVTVEFIWEENAAQKLEYVYLDYNINSKTIVYGQYRITYDWNGIIETARPSLVNLEIPKIGMLASVTVYFKISYVWHTIYGDDQLETPAELHSFNVLYDGQRADIAQRNMILYIVGGSAVFVLALVYLFIRRRR